MSTRNESEFVDMRFGFPVVLKDAPMREVRGELVPAINANVLRDVVLVALAIKPGPLTGNEVRFIRLWMDMTLTRFGGECSVTHAAVKKWEDRRDQPTKMNRTTEFFIRYLVAEKMPEGFVWGHVPRERKVSPYSLESLRRVLTAASEESRPLCLKASDLSSPGVLPLSPQL